MILLYICHLLILGKDTLHALEGVLTRFPKNGKIVGVLVAPTFSEGMDDEIKSSEFEIILTDIVNMNMKLINYASTIPLLNVGVEEFEGKIKDLELRMNEFEKLRQTEIQDLKDSNQELRFFVSFLIFFVVFLIFLIVFLLFLLINK